MAYLYSGILPPSKKEEIPDLCNDTHDSQEHNATGRVTSVWQSKELQNSSLNKSSKISKKCQNRFFAIVEIKQKSTYSRKLGTPIKENQLNFSKTVSFVVYNLTPVSSSTLQLSGSFENNNPYWWWWREQNRPHSHTHTKM